MHGLIRKDLDWLDHAPLRVVANRRIDAPPAQVWAVIADHASWPEWFGGLNKVEPGPVADAVGGTRRITVGPVVADEEFLAFEPDRRFAFVITAMSRRVARSMVEDVLLTPDGDGATTVTYTQGIDPRGGKVVAALLAPGMRRALHRALTGLAGRATRG